VKVNIYETVEVSDADRKLVAAALGQKAATRDDLKAFIWRHGADWQRAIHSEFEQGEAEFTASVSDDGEDLLGGEPAPEDASLDDLLGGSDEDLI
jgi:hypothetical protein